MRVSIVGPGAMGCLFAARLAHCGIRTTLIDHRADRAVRLQRSGVVVESPEGELVAHPAVVTQIPSAQDLVIVLTKAYVTRDLRLPPEQPVLTLQNGLGNVETLCARVGSQHVLVGVTSEGATLLGEGRTRHAGRGRTQIGAWTSCPATPVIEALRKAGFHVEETDAPGQVVWEKVAINNGINPLTAILNVENGKLVDTREVRQLMRDLVVEAAKVAATEGYRFPYSLVERAEEICRETAGNVSSMLQDVRAHRPTEIDAISGEILRRAQEVSLPTPRTRVVWQLVKGIEHY
ncbi:MAG TPA: 2-dehydropantoate 2-reductase [Candidatus Hydrogenedentes bacterium]|nr:2-dehydropantoate 2-reductase [Candidatus Hydrogenedentota bacterium]HPG65304.1 2-dehydropantoate 2-reductase [Candidatus Hydrogenedentota bacterium]